MRCIKTNRTQTNRTVADRHRLMHLTDGLDTIAHSPSLRQSFFNRRPASIATIEPSTRDHNKRVRRRHPVPIHVHAHENTHTAQAQRRAFARLSVVQCRNRFAHLDTTSTHSFVFGLCMCKRAHTNNSRAIHTTRLYIDAHACATRNRNF